LNPWHSGRGVDARLPVSRPADDRPGAAGAERDDPEGLRRALRDLVALSVLPAVWSGYESHRISESLAEVVLKTLSLDLVYVRLPLGNGAGVSEAVHHRRGGGDAADAPAMGRALAPWLGDPFSTTAVVPHPAGDGALRIAVTRFGFGGNSGIMVAGSPRDDFPTEQERLLLSVGANQAAIAIRAKRVEEEKLALFERERAARMEAERASRLRDEFLATVSHELRTPLSSVLGWTQVLRRSPEDEDVRAQALDAIERGARAQVRLIEDLLDMSRIISGKLRLEVQTVELVPLIQAAVETVRPAADAKGTRIEWVLDPRGGPIKGDPARLQQVFWNLLSNAVKFTPRGGKIQVHLERIESQAVISVSDTGRGIAPEFLPFVFYRFRQEDSSTTRHQGGLGLGLAVVKHLVELHGGKVRAKSPGEGMGSTFSVHLPTPVVQRGPHGREHPTAPGAEPTGAYGDVRLTGVRVMVVDDDRDACELFERVLLDCGAIVDLARSGREALAQMSEKEHDVLVSDIGMPEMDGFELIRQLRSRGRQLPAVAVTAFARPQDRIEALEAGFNMHLAKPLEPRELIVVIAALLRSGR
jgi:signal transduction histidine kinase